MYLVVELSRPVTQCAISFELDPTIDISWINLLKPFNQKITHLTKNCVFNPKLQIQPKIAQITKNCTFMFQPKIAHLTKKWTLTINGTINQKLCIEPKITHLLYKNCTFNWKLDIYPKLAQLNENCTVNRKLHI